MFTQRISQAVSVAHRYWNFSWDEARNRSVYGESASQEGVGSNLLVEVEAATDNVSALQAFVRQQLDHRCLYRDIEIFKKQPSTLEAITMYLAGNLKSANLGATSVKVWELDKWAVSLDFASGVPHFWARIRNLTLQLETQLDPVSQLMVNRRELEAQVEATLEHWPEVAANGQWPQNLIETLRYKVKGLIGLTIDLGGQKIVL